MNLSRILNPDTTLQSNNLHFNHYINVITRVLDQPFLLDLIISFIKPSDVSVLHSICLVNRLWCLTAIPYLWSSPFSSSIKIDNLLDIISIYVSCLDEGSQRSLLQLRIENERVGNLYARPHPHKDIKSSLIDSRTDRRIRILRLPPKPSPIFNYPRFMRSLNVYSLYEIIREWLRTTVVMMDLPGNTNEINTIEINNTAIQPELELTENYSHYFTRELFKLFMTRATHLTHLKIDSSGKCSFPYMVIFYRGILQPSLNCADALSHITTLDLNIFNISPNLLLEFSTKCTKISSLSIRACNFPSSTYDLSQLIKRQQSLHHLHLEGITVTSKLIGSLIFHVTTLESLILVNVSIVDSRALWNLSSCSCLRTLTIDFSHRYPQTYSCLKPLWNLHFPEMRKFKLIGELYENAEKSLVANTCSFLELNGKSLRTLSLDLNQNAYSKILPTVGERCTQLRKLTVRSYKQCDKSLGKMLKKTNMELERLKVERKCYSNRSRSGWLFNECEFPPLKELKGARWLRHLDLQMNLDVDFVERLLAKWETPLVRFSYLYKDENEVGRHHKVLYQFAEMLNEGLHRRRERRWVHKIDVKNSVCLWFEMIVLKMEMLIEYVNH